MIGKLILIAIGSAFINNVVLSQFLGTDFGRLSRHLYKGEHHQCEVAFKLAAGLLQLHLFPVRISSVKGFHTLNDSLHNSIFYRHVINEQ